MIYWAQLLHFYQPPNQMASVLKQVCRESYRPLIQVFREHPQARATINMNGALTELLHNHGYNDVIQGLGELAERGQIEFTGSAKYHAILPLIPVEEASRQIEQNRQTNAYFWGKAYRPQGFFPPELAYHPKLLAPVANAGHQWLILSGIACPVAWPLNVIHEAAANGGSLKVFFRDDILSNKISFDHTAPKEFMANLRRLRGERDKAYVVTAMDAETYGHHIKNWEKLFLAELYEELNGQANDPVAQEPATSQKEDVGAAGVADRIQTVTVSELMDLFPRGQMVQPKASSWSTTAQDLEGGNLYPLWADKKNPVHRLQWQHLQLAMEMVQKAQECADNQESQRFSSIARSLLDRALYSDPFWWASRRPMWDLNLVHLGLIEQWRVMVNAHKAINASGVKPKVKRESQRKLAASHEMMKKIVDRLFLP